MRHVTYYRELEITQAALKSHSLLPLCHLMTVTCMRAHTNITRGKQSSKKYLSMTEDVSSCRSIGFVTHWRKVKKTLNTTFTLCPLPRWRYRSRDSVFSGLIIIIIWTAFIATNLIETLKNKTSLSELRWQLKVVHMLEQGGSLK